MVSVANVRQVISSIKGEIAQTREVGFNMNTYVAQIGAMCPVDDMSRRHCKWVACIAGHAYLLATGKLPYQTATEFTGYETVAAKFLGISYDQGLELFIDLPEDIDLETVSADWAIAVLEHLIDHGRINWWVNFSNMRIAA